MLLHPLRVKKATNDHVDLNVLCQRIKVSRTNEDVRNGKIVLKKVRVREVSKIW